MTMSCIESNTHILATEKDLPNESSRTCIMHAEYRHGQGRHADIQYDDPGYDIGESVLVVAIDALLITALQTC